MYQFRIIKLEDDSYRFELGGIKMLISGYNIVNERHSLINPAKAFAYFSFENNIYGISNEAGCSDTAEDFFDTISKQYMMFADKNTLTPGDVVAPLSALINRSGDSPSSLKRSA